jgi:putative ABC transport system ATP-binding protein
MSQTVLQAEGLTKTYRSGANSLTVLDTVSFSVSQGDTLAIIGPSGSGKTTLLGLCAGLDVPSTGIISLMGFKLNAMSEDDRAHIRNQYVGLSFRTSSYCKRSLRLRMLWFRWSSAEKKCFFKSKRSFITGWPG